MRQLAREYFKGAANGTGILYAFFALDQGFKKWLPCQASPGA